LRLLQAANNDTADSSVFNRERLSFLPPRPAHVFQKRLLRAQRQRPSAACGDSSECGLAGLGVPEYAVCHGITGDPLNPHAFATESYPPPCKKVSTPARWSNSPASRASTTGICRR